jgi:glutamate/tyrosine decarboxylase-like PLP-dependent enzyme
MTHPFDIALAEAKAFRASLPDRAPRPEASPVSIQALFDGPTPETGEDGAKVIEALIKAAEPGLGAMSGPRFFAWVIGASNEVGVAADWLASAWGQNSGMLAPTPAAAIAERIAGRWLLNILDLPEESSVAFVTGATMANFTCLAAARNAVLDRAGWDVEAKGLIGAPAVRIFVGEEAHSSLFAALRYLGFGEASAIRIRTDDQGRMDSTALETALAVGVGPAIVAVQAGQINTGAIDPLREIAGVCEAHGAWLHVDGAFGLWARAAPELAHLADGAELADSWATDGHKWLQLPYDSGFAIVKDRAVHARAMTASASYLSEKASNFDPHMFTPELSRRARGFAAWAVIRALGREGIAEMVRRHCALARYAAEKLAAIPGIRILNEVSLNQVNASFGEGDIDNRNALTRAAIERIQSDNAVFVAGSQWREHWAMRISVISEPLRQPDIDRLIEAITRAWNVVQAHQPTPALPGRVGQKEIQP